MKTVLFLCTGNTCRSPMAACLFAAQCQAMGLPLAAASAGLYAQPGAPASAEAQAAMAQRGLSLQGHGAQPLTQALAGQAALIVAMTPQHAAQCRERFPGLATPVRSFDPPIPDPYGGDLAVYQATAAALEAQIRALCRELASQP